LDSLTDILDGLPERLVPLADPVLFERLSGILPASWMVWPAL
jgi:hypothetical protein